MAAAQEQHI